MASELPKGRHVDYAINHWGMSAATVVPTVASIPPESPCLDSPIPITGGRIVDYVRVDTNSGTGIPIVASAPKCCDAFSNSNSGRVEQGCWTASGIMPVILLRFYDVGNCESASGKKIKATYSSGSIDNSGNRQWVADNTVAFRGGSLQFYVSCSSGLPLDSGSKFRLTWRGCSSGDVFSLAGCSDPLTVDFGQTIAPLGTCCDCNRTVNSPHIRVTAETNCHPTTTARHIDYLVDGTPVVATENCSVVTDVRGCSLMTCGVVISITNVTGCACMAGTYNLDYSVSNAWLSTIAMCVGPATVRMTCQDELDQFGKTTGNLILTMTITCGATNTGQGTVTILKQDIEDLDVTFTINMTDPVFSSCTGNCNYVWIAMAVAWFHDTVTGDTCSASCSPCPLPPTDNSPGTVDGQTRSLPCTSTAALSCCIGTISVRVTR